MNIKKQKLYFSLVLSAVLTACGGGSGSSSVVTADTNTIKGVAATGAPIANAPVYIKDSTGAEPKGQSEAEGKALVTTDENGLYAFPDDTLKGLQSPFIVRVAGNKVLDSGDDATAILHAVVATTTGARVNLTPLTEAATILTLGTDTASAFAKPQDSVAVYKPQAAQDANQTLLNALKLPAGVSSIDLVSGELDATPSANLSNPSAAKQYDMLLDTLAFSSSQGQLILTDRNRPESEFTSGPQIKVSAAGATPTGTMVGVQTDGILDSKKLQSFIDRFNAQLKAGCSVPLIGTYQDTCGNVVSSSNKVFATDYKHTGMTADKWLSSWVATPMDVEDLSGVTVSLKAAFRGTFVASNNKRVTRVALKFARGDDFVIRTLLLTDNGTEVVVLGNQQDYFLWARPRLSVNPDADDAYPFNPKYQVGMQFILKHWYAGMPRMILGAHIDGPGLPTTRLANLAAPSGEPSNPNGLSSGIELFYRTDEAAGCTNMSVDPIVYIEKNTRSWDAAWTDYKTNSYDRTRLYDGSIRWRSGNNSCDPTFDMRRYYGSAGTPVIPKRGDSYTVTLYLDANKWGGANQPSLPSGAGARVTGKVNSDGDSISYYPLVVTETLRADAFELPTTVASTQLPGVTDATRSRLLTFSQGKDRLVEWTRNLISWQERDSSGNAVNTSFGNFLAGVFMSSRDQVFTADNGYVSLSPFPTTTDWPNSIPRGFKDYRGFFTTSAGGNLTIANNGGASGRLDLDCGKTASFKGGTVRVRVRKVTNTQSNVNTNERGYEEVTCAQAQTAMAGGVWNWVNNSQFYRNGTQQTETTRYQYDVVRDRVNFQSDKNTLVLANQTSRTITWDQMMAREPVGSQALCSSVDGAYAYRKAYVVMIDMNGRQIMENREVSADLPGAIDIANKNLNLATRYTTVDNLRKAVDGETLFNPPLTRKIDISRPNYLTDTVYLPMTFDVSDYDLSSTVPAGVTDYAWNPAGNNWHAQPGVIQPAYSKAAAGTTSCTKVTF
jgi:hypothetical protein